jgi:hypothetical protein
MDLEYKVTSIRDFAASENAETLSFHVDFELVLWVHHENGTKSEAIHIDINDFFFNFTILIEDMQVYAHISDIHLLSIEKAEAQFGARIPFAGVTKFINMGFIAGKELFNDFISRIYKVKVPDTLFKLFKLSDLKIVYHDNYLEAGLTPTFLAPTLPDYEAELEQRHRKLT